MRSGETDKAVTVAKDRFEGIVDKMIKSLRVRGNLDCDFLEQDDKIYLLEMNPRFGGGYPFTHEAGANHVQRLIDFSNQQTSPNTNTKRMWLSQNAIDSSQFRNKNYIIGD